MTNHDFSESHYAKTPNEQFAAAISIGAHTTATLHNPDFAPACRVTTTTVKDDQLIPTGVILAVRFADAPENIREAAQALNLAIADYLEELKANKPND